LISKARYSEVEQPREVVDNLKTKNSTLVEASESVVVIDSTKMRSSKIDDIEPLSEISREERKKEASKPLYLVRYE
jgi:hypothetical protein